MADLPDPAAGGAVTPPWARHALWVMLRHAISITVILGLMWAVARPHAQMFIEETVDDRISQLEEQMDDVQRSMTEQSQSQAVMSNEIENLSRNQDETRANTRMILQSLQGMRRELRAE